MKEWVVKFQNGKVLRVRAYFWNAQIGAFQDQDREITVQVNWGSVLYVMQAVAEKKKVRRA